MPENMKRGRETLTAIFAIHKDECLTLGEKNLWTLYRAHDHKGRGSWPGDELLAQLMGRSVRSVQLYRAGLVEKGYLKQTLRGPRPAVYKAVLPETVDQNRLASKVLGFKNVQDAVQAVTRFCLSAFGQDRAATAACRRQCSHLLPRLNSDALWQVVSLPLVSEEEIEREVSRQVNALLRGEKP